MSDPTLEAIDHALNDWRTSGDAMRWTPTAPRPIAPVVAVNFDPERYREAFTRVGQEFSQIIDHYRKSLEKLAQLRAAARDQEATERRAHLHASYRQRQLARRRRNRRRR